MNKLLLRLGVVGAVATGTVWAIRKYRANKDQTDEYVQKGVDAATELIKKAGVLVDVAVTQFAFTWLKPKDQDEPDDEPEPDSEPEPDDEPEQPSDQFAHNGPLLDDGSER